MSHRAPKQKRKAQPRNRAATPTTTKPTNTLDLLQPSPRNISLSSDSSSCSKSSDLSSFLDFTCPSNISPTSPSMPTIATRQQDTPNFIAAPGVTTLQPPISLAELLATVAANPAPVWPIQDLLPAGLCLLAAKPHAGSRTLALQLALSIANGTPALDNFATHAGDVLYLGFHDTPATLLAQTLPLLADTTTTQNIHWTNTWQPYDQDGLSALTTWLEEHPSTRLLVIDSLSTILPPGTSSKRVHALLRQLNHLAHTHHLAILLLHITTRSITRDPFDAIACSPLLLEICDTLAVLDHSRTSEQATLHLTGRALSTRALPLTWETSSNRWHLTSTTVLPITSPTSPETLPALAMPQPLILNAQPSLSHTTIKPSLFTTILLIQICETPVTPTLSSSLPGLLNPLSPTRNAPSTPPTNNAHAR